MKQIKLSQGQFALVDDDDFELLNQYNWFANKHRNTFYARRNIRLSPTKRTAIQMHRVIVDCPVEKMIDHIVALVIMLNVAFTGAVLYVFLRTGAEPTSLVIAWFAFHHRRAVVPVGDYEGKNEGRAGAMKIYIDIGHGGSDPGAVSGNFVEHQMAIVTGMAMADRLLAYGHQVKVEPGDLSITDSAKAANAFNG